MAYYNGSGTANRQLFQSPFPNPNGNIDPISISHRSYATESSSARTNMAQSVLELDAISMTSNIPYNQRNNNVQDLLRAVARKHEINMTMAERLLILRNFEIVIVCDDSGSMKTLVDGTQRSRWDELRSIVKIVLEIGVIFDQNGVDIYFLNRPSFLRVKDPREVDQAFFEDPAGYTPLVPVLENIFQSQLANPRRDKKLLVFVATDGLPTDDNGNEIVPELERIMRETRRAETTYVSFLLCTDEQACVDCFNEWDRTMVNVDATDDFNTERERIRHCRGADYRFSHGDYVVKALVGAVDREIDVLNEP